MMTKLKLTMALVFLLAGTASGRQAPVSGGPNFFDNYVEVKGIGNPLASAPANSPLAYATAQRAAVIVANRNLAEIIAGIQVDSTTDVANTALDADKIRASVSARIKGGQVVNQTSMAEFIGNDASKRGFVEVTLRVPLTGSGGVISAIMPTLRPEIIKRTDEANLPVFAPAAAAAPAAPAARPAANPVPTAPPPVTAAAAADYDGLIVRVPSDFKPALAPKILTEKGEILYSAKDVAADILISRGAAQYTINEGKAKTILEGMGARSILDLQGGLRTDTDAEVKNDDAAKVFNANRKTSFLNKARVVFLVAKSS